MKFRAEIIVRDGTKVLANIEGCEIDGDSLNLNDSIGKVIDIEHTLERLTGHSFHINLHPVSSMSVSTIDRLLDEERRNR